MSQNSLPRAERKGSYHAIRRFSGFKFVPPGLHLVTWSLAPSSSTGPAAIPIRHALIRILEQKERVVLTFDPQTETMRYDDQSVISDDHLRTLDGELAPYPFDGLDRWKELTRWIDRETLQVLGEQRIVDGLTHVIGEETHKGEEVLSDMTAGIQFVQFKLRKSWKTGAVGEEVTRFSKDKSWLLGDVVNTQLNKSKRITQHSASLTHQTRSISWASCSCHSSYSCIYLSTAHCPRTNASCRSSLDPARSSCTRSSTWAPST